MIDMFPRTIIRRRCLVGYSMTELAQLVGISVSYMSLIERGLRPPPVDAKLTAMADVLGIARDEMFWMAGRLPPDVKAWVQRHPESVTALVRDMMRK